MTCEIAEEYANTGIRIIEDILNESDDFYSILKMRLFDLYSNNLFGTLDNMCIK